MTWQGARGIDAGGAEDYLAAGLGSFAIAVAIAALFSAGLINFLPMRMTDVMIAMAPGAADVMLLLALALHVDPVYVGAHHVTRIMLVSLTMPFLARKVAHAPPPEAAKAVRQPPTFQD